MENQFAVRENQFTYLFSDEIARQYHEYAPDEMFTRGKSFLRFINALPAADQAKIKKILSAGDGEIIAVQPAVTFF